MDIFGLGPMEILLILIIGLLIFGPDKLPKIGRDLGKAFRTFRKASSDLSNEVTKELEAVNPEKKDESKQESQKTDVPNTATYKGSKTEG
jgi:sec-independent protein translocase protein TatA